MKSTLKRTISAVLACMLLLALLPASALAASWENHWSSEYIQTAIDRGWIEADAADPGREVTRAEAAEILGKVLGSPVTTGEADAAALTRQDAIVMLADAFGLKAADKDAAASFADWADVADAAQDAVAAVVEKGIVNGVGGNRLAPAQTITLGELVKIVVKANAVGTTAESTLKAGAGTAEIVFDQAMFPVEGFSGEVHLNPYARVLVLEQGMRTAIVSLELVNVPAETIATVKSIVSEKTGTPTENIWVHTTHAITTPHAPSDAAQLELYKASVNTAVTEAAEQAAASFQPAMMGIGTGTSDVNSNHGIELSSGWYIGMDSTMPSNKEMTVLRFDAPDGDPIGFLISYGIKPTAIDNVEMKDNTRKLSSDVPGVACQLMEEEFGVPVMFCMPAAADQIPREVTTYYVENESGEAVKVETSVEEGIEIVERLGAEMGEDAISIAKGITCADDTQAISMQDTSFTWPSKSGDGEVNIDVRGLAIGDDLAFVGFKPEVNALTEQQLWEASPYEHTLLMSFVDGDQKYMPDAEAHDLQTWEFQRSGTAKGSAEQFVATATELLEDMKASANSALKAGAGAAEIVFDQAMFPVEGFSGEVHLNPYIRVLVLEQDIKTAIVAAEVVNFPADVISTIKEIVSEKTGTPTGNIWVHATHAITTPHAPSDAAQLELYKASVTAAVTEAAEQAAASFQPAMMGIGTGTSDVNSNHGIELSSGWYIGMDSTMPSNKEMTVLRFDALDGDPIGFLISYGIKPTAIDNVEMKDNTRKLSSDVPGVACQLMEEEFGVPVMFCMPAAADQIPREVTTYYVENENGEAVKVETSVEEGIEIVERLGAEMGEDAISIAKGITCTNDKQAIVAADTSFTWPSKSGDGEVNIDVRGLTIGDDLAFVGFKPEVNALTEQQLWEASPYEHTLLMSFVDGDQKYMPDAEAHDLQTWEFQRSGTAKGSAEQFVATATDLLKGIQSGEIVNNTQSGSQTETGTAEAKKTIQMGGYNWIVLDEQDGKMLVLSERILESRAYHSAGGAITWENCELRAYLNGEFYEKTFTAEEKARIVETTIENKSNPQYGIAGGNDTTDKVFLLSLSEAEQYLGDGIELLRATDVTTGEGNWWHLRSPGEATDVAASINIIGLVDYHGVVDGVTDPTGGVRPAMWITAD